MTSIIAITITATECAPEADAMVCRTFRTASGWASAFAAIQRDAADIPGALAYVKVFGLVSLEDGSAQPLRLEVRAGDAAPFGSEEWAWLGERFDEVHAAADRRAPRAA